MQAKKVENACTIDKDVAESGKQAFQIFHQRLKDEIDEKGKEKEMGRKERKSGTCTQAGAAPADETANEND